MIVLQWLAVALLSGGVGVMATVTRQRKLERSLRASLTGAEAARLALVKSQRWADLVSEVAHVGYWRLDAASHELVWSPEMFRIRGLDAASGPPPMAVLMDAIHPDDRPAADAFQAGVIAGKVMPPLRMRVRRPDGTARTVSVRSAPEYNAAGEVVAMFGALVDVTDEVDADEALRASETRYRLLAENATDMIARLNLDGRVNFITSACKTVLGYTPAEVISLDPAELAHPDDTPALQQIFEACRTGAPEAQSAVLQYRARHKDGRWIWVESQINAIRDPFSGAPVAMLTVVRDVRARKELEAELIKAREEAEAAYGAELEARRWVNLAEEVAHVGYWQFDPATEASKLSDEMYRIFGFDIDAPVTLEDQMNMVHPDDRAWAHAALANLLAKGEVFDSQIRILRADGETRTVAVRSAVERNESDGAVRAIFGTVIDITELTLVDQALRASEARYRLMAENAADVITQVGLDGVVTFVSPACETVLGYAPAEIVGRPMDDLVHPGDRSVSRTALEAAMRGGPGGPLVSVETRIRHKDGRWLWVEGQPKVIFDPVTGAPTSIQGVVRDISARKAMHAELVEAKRAAEQAAAVKSEFLANMTHELRTPLTSILGFSKLLEADEGLDEQARHHVEQVVNASRSLLSTVNDLLDFSKLEAGQVVLDPQPTVLRSLAVETLELFKPQAEAKGLTLAIEVRGRAPQTVLIDPVRVRQILLNLVNNAVKFTEQGSVTLTLAHRAGRLRVEVIDTGEGVPDDRLDRLFQRFSQVDASSTRLHGGTGLGLAICKGLAEAMDGEIGVRSEAGRGSCFWFDIAAPTVRAAKAAPIAQAAQLPSMTAGRVLVVDDHRANRDLVRAILSSVGVDVAEAADGIAAVEAAKTEVFDLILMDMRMPAMDGPMATRAIRDADGPNRRTPILAFTADARIDQASMADGFDGYVAKPIAPADLLAAVSRWLAPETESEVAEASRGAA